MPQMFCFQCQQTAGNKGCTHGRLRKATGNRPLAGRTGV